MVIKYMQRRANLNFCVSSTVITKYSAILKPVANALSFLAVVNATLVIIKANQHIQTILDMLRVHRKIRKTSQI